ncbi:UNVERIFIED_CONTAM: hypothetical protein FKN15_011611 [Acipenser sinensis]
MPGTRTATGSASVVFPLKKKFKNSAPADSGKMADPISLLLQQHQKETAALITTTVSNAVLEIKSSLQEHLNMITTLKIDLTAHVATVQQLVSKVDSVRLKSMERKVADLEDRSRRNNIRLVGLPEGIEGEDAVGFLQDMLPKWFPALSQRKFEIERGHRIYGHFSSDDRKPRQLILQESRKGNPIREAGGNILLFYADYSHATSQLHRAFTDVRKAMRDAGVRSFLIYLATLKVTHNNTQHSFTSVQEAEDFYKSNMGLPFKSPGKE